MTIVHNTFKIQSDRLPTFHDVTEEVQALLKSSGIENGIVVVYSQHTTCSVFIQEDADDVNFWGTKFLLQDLVNIFEQVIPTCRTEGQNLHPGPKHIEMAKSRNELPAWSLNTDAHLRSVIMGRSQTIPILNGSLELGEFGRIYFADFDQTRARERTVIVQIIGE
jgi:secondary thiamine-phosphate synthase enzyme